MKTEYSPDEWVYVCTHFGLPARQAAVQSVLCTTNGTEYEVVIEDPNGIVEPDTYKAREWQLGSTAKEAREKCLKETIRQKKKQLKDTQELIGLLEEQLKEVQNEN